MRIILTNFLTEYANMMADLFNASKPKKSKALSKMGELPTITDQSKSTTRETTSAILADFNQSKSKGAGGTIDKK